MAMSCGCENRERMKVLQRVRELAEKAARLTGEVQCIIRKGEGWQFLPLTEIKDEEILEYVI